MIKLCRNTLGDWKILKDPEGNMIEWNYFKKLVSLQEKKELHAGTKIRQRHLSYYKEKIKVRLATQLFSTSVTDAIQYCREKLKLNDFCNSLSTENLARKLNDIFDFLNTRNFLSKSIYNKPLKLDNEQQIKLFIAESIKYLEGLQDQNNEMLITSRRKTGFIGLIVCLKSAENLFDDLLKTGELNFILTYKISQDHLEMFFSAITAKGGFNNNPTTMQFEAAYKKLLIHTELKTSEGANCTTLDNTTILSVSSLEKRS